jgi:hypothetical protein
MPTIIAVIATAPQVAPAIRGMFKVCGYATIMVDVEFNNPWFSYDVLLERENVEFVQGTVMGLVGGVKYGNLKPLPWA